MIYEKYNNIPVIIHWNSNLMEYLEKAIEKIKKFNHHNYFKLKNIDNKVEIILDCVYGIYRSELQK
jgi:hypothetical protein